MPLTRRKYFSYLRPHLPALLMALLLSVPLAFLNFSPAPALKYLTDHVLVGHEVGAVRKLAFGVLGGFALNLLLRFSTGYLIRSAAASATQRIRNDLYSHILGLSLGYFNEARGGALVGRVINDVQTLSRFLTNVVDAVKDPLIFCSLLGYAVWLNWRLALITGLILPVAAVILGNSGKHSKRYSQHILAVLGEMSAAVSESLSGMRVIQSFSLEPALGRRFQRLNRDFTRYALKAIRVESLATPGVELVFGLVMTVLIYFSGSEALAGRMSAGDVIAFFTCFGMMLGPLKSLNDLNIAFQQSAAAMDSLSQIFATRPDVAAAPNSIPMPAFRQEIVFEHVTLRYPGQESAALADFDFTLRRGEVVALVGPSGAGKSSVLGLLPRFFDVQEGRVLVDGRDLRDFSLDSLRSQVAYVTQEVFLFHDTVRANIRGGLHSASEGEIVAAAKAAQAWSFIEKLPRGLDTVIGDRGQKLSGGERQRLSIARAVLKNAPILLLDEATSALDTENELLVQAALDQLMVGRTALVVAHRLSTIRRANRILVMEKGRILELGSHEELLARNGAYARALSSV
jgi:ATP-binding cassette, subfamily B, bacterial MsbA